jgi:hypothetical protein
MQTRTLAGNTHRSVEGKEGAPGTYRLLGICIRGKKKTLQGQQEKQSGHDILGEDRGPGPGRLKNALLASFIAL